MLKQCFIYKCYVQVRVYIRHKDRLTDKQSHVSLFIGFDSL